MNEIFEKYIEEIKKINNCGADVIMDSVWANLLGRFYAETESYLEKIKNQ